MNAPRATMFGRLVTVLSGGACACSGAGGIGSLAGVSAGVIGLDANGRIELPNRAADELLGMDLIAKVSHELAAAVPEFAPLLRQASTQPERAAVGEVVVGPPNRHRTLLVRIGAERGGGRTLEVEGSIRQPRIELGSHIAVEWSAAAEREFPLGG